ncbi:hypothetical protein K431DRAFT_300160 [Polychaeton citri CBS 116435]|uniref:Uncharacterized protein n=1 Tax=Polychaeton citri CBS 116435 TaxID=1314669 RepID=A0A9P4QI17_9PEZI|nr:hypothetical protein K431DRAFT_300160 [Polychaeton citri CBS 116435]
MQAQDQANLISGDMSFLTDIPWGNVAEPYNGYGATRSPSLSVTRSPDTASPIYPERAIRPLPRSRLKSKLSPEQYSSISYPPDPPPISPALNLSVRGLENGIGADEARGGNVYVNGEGLVYSRSGHASRAMPTDHDHEHCGCDHDHIDSGDEEVEFDHPDHRYALPLSPTAPNGKQLDSVQRRLMHARRQAQAGKPPPPASTGSSADGYESFENTSNKKKRKIPLSSTHQTQLSTELANMGISGHGDGVEEDYGQRGWTHAGAPPVGATGSGTGISGAGRGRYGRQNGRHDMRRPLGTNTMNSVNGYSTRVAPNGSVSADLPSEEKPGIITQAIKSAAEQGPLTPQKGKENVASLLQQHSSSTPKTQFTFSCESDSSNRMVDAQHQAAAQAAAGYGSPTPAGYARGSMNQAMPGPLPSAKGVNAQGTQTMPPPHPGNVGNTQQSPALPQGNQQAPPPKPKPRRRPSKEYAIAARQRKLQQEYQNYHNRPKPQDMWICEFCEYEDIFGVPPHALIRSYEIKDRQERKKAAEKRRLLEKAKMKGRKNKAGKGGKGKNKGSNGVDANGNPPLPAPNGAPYDPNLPPPGEEEYYDDDYDGDEYEPIDPNDGYPPDGYYPPPPPASTPAIAAHGSGGGGGDRHKGAG